MYPINNTLDLTAVGARASLIPAQVEEESLVFLLGVTNLLVIFLFTAYHRMHDSQQLRSGYSRLIDSQVEEILDDLVEKAQTPGSFVENDTSRKLHRTRKFYTNFIKLIKNIGSWRSMGFNSPRSFHYSQLLDRNYGEHSSMPPMGPHEDYPTNSAEEYVNTSSATKLSKINQERVKMSRLSRALDIFNRGAKVVVQYFQPGNSVTPSRQEQNRMLTSKWNSKSLMFKNRLAGSEVSSDTSSSVIPDKHRSVGDSSSATSTVLDPVRWSESHWTDQWHALLDDLAPLVLDISRSYRRGRRRPHCLTQSLCHLNRRWKSSGALTSSLAPLTSLLLGWWLRDLGSITLEEIAISVRTGWKQDDCKLIRSQCNQIVAESTTESWWSMGVRREDTGVEPIEDTTLAPDSTTDTTSTTTTTEATTITTQAMSSTTRRKYLWGFASRTTEKVRPLNSQTPDEDLETHINLHLPSTPNIEDPTHLMNAESESNENKNTSHDEDPDEETVGQTTAKTEETDGIASIDTSESEIYPNFPSQTEHYDSTFPTEADYDQIDGTTVSNTETQQNSRQQYDKTASQKYKTRYIWYGSNLDRNIQESIRNANEDKFDTEYDQTLERGKYTPFTADYQNISRSDPFAESSVIRTQQVKPWDLSTSRPQFAGLPIGRPRRRQEVSSMFESLPSLPESYISDASLSVSRLGLPAERQNTDYFSGKVDEHHLKHQKPSKSLRSRYASTTSLKRPWMKHGYSGSFYMNTGNNAINEIRFGADIAEVQPKTPTHTTKFTGQKYWKGNAFDDAKRTSSVNEKTPKTKTTNYSIGLRRGLPSGGVRGIVREYSTNKVINMFPYKKQLQTSQQSREHVVYTKSPIGQDSNKYWVQFQPADGVTDVEKHKQLYQFARDRSIRDISAVL